MDTHVKLLDPEYNLIGGYLALWRAWANGIADSGDLERPDRFYLVPGRYVARGWPGTPIYWEHSPDDDYGYLKTLKADRHGLYGTAILYHSGLLLDCAAGQLFWSIGLRPAQETPVKGGSRLCGGEIFEVSLTPTPAIPPSPDSLKTAEFGRYVLSEYQRRFATIAASESALTLTTRPVGRAYTKDLTAQAAILGGTRQADGWWYDVVLPTGEVVQARPGRNFYDGLQFYIPEVE
jgi:hypothetical protein